MKYIYSINISKRKHISRIIACILIFICFATGKTAYAQSCLSDVLHNPLYSNSNDIINGTKWVYEKKYLGSLLLVENYWPRVNILYKGIQFSQVSMNFDLVKNQAIVFDHEKDKEKYILIDMNYFKGFNYTDSLTGQKHIYEYFELPGVKGIGLYENLSTPKFPFFIRPGKLVEARAADKDIAKLVNHFDNYIKIKDDFILIHSKRQLIDVLGTHTTELKRYIRQKNLKINNFHPENISIVLNYFEKLD